MESTRAFGTGAIGMGGNWHRGKCPGGNWHRAICTGDNLTGGYCPGINCPVSQTNT